MFLNIWSGVKWGALLVPVRIINVYFFSLAGVQQITSYRLWWHLERFAPWSFCFSLFYSNVNLIKLNHPLLRWCLSSKCVVYWSFLVQTSRLRFKVVISSSLFDVANNSLCLAFSIKTISWLIALSATSSKGVLPVWSKFISHPDLISAYLLSLCALLILNYIFWDKFAAAIFLFSLISSKLSTRLMIGCFTTILLIDSFDSSMPLNDLFGSFIIVSMLLFCVNGW